MAGALILGVGFTIIGAVYLAVLWRELRRPMPTRTSRLLASMPCDHCPYKPPARPPMAS